MARIPIALQLYSIREDCARDLEGSIEAVAGMGYEGVEFAGYYQRGADELKGLCAAHGLEAPRWCRARPGRLDKGGGRKRAQRGSTYPRRRR